MIGTLTKGTRELTKPEKEQRAAAATFWSTFKGLCDENGVSPYKVGTEIGLSGQTPHSWFLNYQVPSEKWLIRIAQYFNCSVEYLTTGKEASKTSSPKTEEKQESVNETEMKPLSFGEIFSSLCKKKGISLYRMAKDLGVSSSVPFNWAKKGIVPNCKNLEKLAKYFDCSADYLLTGNLEHRKEINELHNEISNIAKETTISHTQTEKQEHKNEETETKTSSVFWAAFEALCKKNEVSPLEVVKAIGISCQSMYNWRNKSIIPARKNMIKIGRYLKCPVEHLLTGKPFANGEETGEERFAVLNRIIACLKSTSKSQRQLCMYIGIGPANFSCWKTGKCSSYLNHIAKIAEFLGVSEEYLLTGNERKEDKRQEEILSETTPKYEQEQNTCEEDLSEEMSCEHVHAVITSDTQEKKLLARFRQLGNVDKARILERMQCIIDYSD